MNKCIIIFIQYLLEDLIMNKTKITEDLDSLTYAMSDEEICNLNHIIMEKMMAKNHITDMSKVSFEKKNGNNRIFNYSSPCKKIN